MNEESDGINESENNSSEVVILPERSHVEELLLSDQSQFREEQNAYERKLDEKLKDLGLYEDDMTINQKEELLAVVVISCETAEQEENKRQLIREYLEGAQNLEEEIEFSYQESAWLADEANLLSSAITQSRDGNISANKKISSFVDGEEASTSGIKSFDSITQAEKSSRMSPDIFEDETEYSEISRDPQPSTSDSHSKKSEHYRSRLRGGKRDVHPVDANVKIAIAHPIIHDEDATKTETTEVLDRQISVDILQLSFQREKLLLEKSIGCWKPCTSPKDTPMSNFRFNERKEENVSAATLQEKFNKYLASFEKIASSLKSKRSFIPKVTQLNKPYVLLHHGSVAKKVTKLDNYDYMVGVSEKSQMDEENDDSFTPCNTLTRAKSAFHRVKPLSHNRLVSFCDQNLQETSSKMAQPGASYASKRLRSERGKCQTSPEIILEDSCNQLNCAPKDNVSFPSEKHVTFHKDVVGDSNNKLPKFSDLRPDITKCKMVVPSPIIQKEPLPSSNAVKSNCDSLTSNSAKKPRIEEISGNKPADYSSDSSSPLIDVETVVDEEVDNIVLKRKLTPGGHKSLNAAHPVPSKRLNKEK